MSSTRSLSSTSTHNSIAFLRVPKSGFGGKAKTQSKNKTKSGQAEEEEKEEWYIPYKGPYEPAPAATTKRSRSRDSWGDPVPGVKSGVGDGDGVDSHQGDPQQRLRSQSHSSTQNKPNSLRPDYSSQSPKITSYINLDAAGGVGNSPVPLPSSSRQMLHAGYGFDGSGDGTGRPWSAREARGSEGAEAPRTLKQRSSLASLFEKKYSLLKKLSKLGLGAGKGPSRVNPGQSQPPSWTQSYQRPLPPSPGAVSPRPGSRTRPPSLRIDPPPSSRLTVDEHHEDIMVVPRSPNSETGTRSVSVYSQPSPFVPLTLPRSVQHQEEPKDKEWAQLRRVEREEEKTPTLRLTPPPVVVVEQDNPTTSPHPLTASSISSFARTLSSADSYSHSDSHSRSNSHSHSQSHSQHSASAPAPPLGIVDEDDSHVDSYYDMLITSSVSQSPPPPVESRTITSGPSNNVDERHPYAYAVTFPSGHTNPPSLSNDSDPVYSYRGAGKQKTRLSPIPQSRPSLALRSVASSPDLIGREKGRFGESDGAEGMDGVDMSRLRPHVREKLQSTGGRGGGKDRWLSTDLIAIFLPKPKFRIKAKSEKTKKNNGKERSQSSTDLPSSVGHDNHHRHHQGAPSDVVRHVGDDTHHMAEFGVQRLSDVQEEAQKQSSTSRRKSYAYDDLSLLSLDRVLEERDKLEKDRIKWQAQAVKSLGNKHARIVSRSRSKSLTQAGRKMRGIPGQPPPPQPHRHHIRGQQSSIDYLAARACLGDQDLIPVVDEDDAVIDIGHTPTPVRRPQFDIPRHNDRERHERMPSGSSGLATSSGGHRSSSARSGSGSADNNNHHHHKRNDSWSRFRIATSLPQLCGAVKDDDDTDQNNNRRIQHQPQPQPPLRQQHDPASLQVTLKTDSPSDTLLNPITGDNNETRKPSPSPSNASGGGVLVGIAISTPPESQEPAYRDYHHPYTIGAHRAVDDSKRNDDEDSSGRSPPDIRLPDHPYGRGLSSSISRCVAGEREPDYVGPHPAVAVAMTKELMANLGLSELSARHRLPPQVILAHHPPPVIRVDSGGQISQAQAQPQQQLQKPKSSNQLYVKVDDTRNSYQDLQPYVRADSNAQPSDRLWVTYSPGTVREVMPNEVFQYSPYISNQDVAHVASSGPASTSGPASISSPDPVSASSDGAGTDFFLQRYQRMSTVYQDTAAMSQALGNAMYDSSTQDARRRRRRKRSVGSGSTEHQQSTTTTATTSRELVTTTTRPHVVLDLPETTDTIASQEQQLLALRYTVTPPPPRVLFGPRLNTTPPKHTADSVSNLSLSRVSSPILPRSSPSTENHHFVVFTDPFPGRGGRAVSAASPEHSSSGTGTSPPTSPTIPRVGSPDNLEPFHGLFYRPPGGSETDSPVLSPSRQLARIPDPDEEGEVLLDDAPWIPRLGGSGLTTLMKEVNDELEQMVLERQREEQRERSGSIRSSSTLQSQRPSTSDSASTSTTSKGGSGGGGGVRRSRRINTEAGPLDFVLDRRMLPQQDPPTTQSGYVPRPNRISTFYPSTPIPEDIEFSRASSPFEGTAEDETVRLPAGSSNNANQTGPPPTTMNSMSHPPPHYPTEEEYLALYYPDGVRASYLTTTDTLSRISTLSEFPVPPNGITPEEISILTAHPR
ncbi:hypothetical protein JOM56_000046 [Amanita muscaria]